MIGKHLKIFLHIKFTSSLARIKKGKFLFENHVSSNADRNLINEQKALGVYTVPLI